MRPHQRFAIDDASQVGEARRAAQALARELGFDPTAAGRLALGVTELGTNLMRHAGGGALLLGVEALAGEDRPGVALISLDSGPGMDLDRCLADGYSTAGSAGTGLGAVKRMADEFAAFTPAGRGSVIAAFFGPQAEVAAPRTPAAGSLCVAGIGLAAPLEEVSGDGWGQRHADGHTCLMMADGLGHGPQAAEAADAVLQLFQRGAAPGGTSPAALLEQAHEGMRSTRGAAVAIASIDAAGNRLLYAGAGNIAGRLITGISDRSLLSQHGTLGVQIRKLQDMAYDWPEHAVLVLHSDGIVTRWGLDDVPGLLQCPPRVIAGWIIRDHCRGRDDATVLVARRH